LQLGLIPNLFKVSGSYVGAANAQLYVPPIQTFTLMHDCHYYFDKDQVSYDSVFLISGI